MELGLYNGRMMTAQEFERDRNGDELAVCKVCERHLHTYGTKTLSPETRFDHEDGANDCPLSAANLGRYKFLDNLNRETFHGEQRRSAFFETENLKIAYSFCLHMVGKGSLPHQKFGRLCALADSLDIWSYRVLPSWSVPFIFLALDDFEIHPISSSEGVQKKPYSVRFIIKKPKKGVSLRPEDCSIEKYFAPKTGKPSTLVKPKSGISNPLPMSEKVLIDVAGDVSWINERLLLLLTQYSK